MAGFMVVINQHPGEIFSAALIIPCARMNVQKLLTIWRSIGINPHGHVTDQLIAHIFTILHQHLHSSSYSDLQLCFSQDSATPVIWLTLRAAKFTIMLALKNTRRMY